MSLTDALSAKRAEIVDLLLRTNAPVETERADLQQFLTGYLNIITAAARDDYGPRDEFLGSVIPGLRESGISLATILAGLVRFATATAAVLGPEHAHWLCSFQSDYVTRIVTMWERK